MAPMLALAATILAANACAAAFTVDPAASTVQFRVRHLLVNRVHGEFKRLRGRFDYEPGNPASWRADVEIDAASIDTGIEKRDRHLRSEDFLHVSSHPAIRFVSTDAEPTVDGAFQLKGKLTIRGVTRPVVLEVEPLPAPEGRVRFKAEASVDRTHFGVGHNDRYKTGAAAIGREVTIVLEVEASD